jgi:hypothetical protein
MNKQLPLYVVIAIALAILAGTFYYPTQAAPNAAPTPIAAPGAAGTPTNVVFWDRTALTEDTQSPVFAGGAYNRLDLQYTIDQTATGTVNTTTLTFQTSCTGREWDTGVAIVTDNAADATGVIVLPNSCRYQSVNANVSNSTAVTVTVLGIAKQ